MGMKYNEVITFDVLMTTLKLEPKFINTKLPSSSVFCLLTIVKNPKDIRFMHLLLVLGMILLTELLLAFGRGTSNAVQKHIEKM